MSRYLHLLKRWLEHSCLGRWAEHSCSAMAMSLVVLVVLPLFVQAAPLDSQRDIAYRMDLALHIREHRLLTPLFTEQVEKELLDALRRDFGRPCRVELAHDHPRLQEIATQGWGVLDRPHPIDDRKVHFVLIEYNEGQYEVQARQVDGSTGLVTRLRRVRTPDRLYVARLAALTVARDFGVVGTVTEVRSTISRQPIVKLELKGAALGLGGSTRVEPGEVFALCEIRRGNEGEPAQGNRVPGALLYVDTVGEDGCRTRLFHRFENPLRKDARTLGHRAIKLGTQAGPLKLRVLDGQTSQALRGCGVEVSDSGFDNMTGLGATNAQGWIQSERSFRHVAFVRMTWSGVKRAVEPIPLLDDQPVEFPLAITDQLEFLPQFQFKFRQWARNVRDANQRVSQAYRDIEELAKKGQREAAMKRAAELNASLQKDLEQLRQGLKELENDAAKAGPIGARHIAEGHEDVAMLESYLKNIADYAKTDENPTLRRAQMMEASAEAEEAMKLYEAALKENPSQPAVAAHLKKLQEAWRIKSEKHESARRYIYGVKDSSGAWKPGAWERVNWVDLEAKLPRAQEELAVCEAAGDFLTARKLLKVNAEHAKRLAEALETLSPDTNSEDQQKALSIEKAAKALASMNKRIEAFLERSR